MLFSIVGLGLKIDLVSDLLLFARSYSSFDSHCHSPYAEPIGHVRIATVTQAPHFSQYSSWD